MIQRVIIFILVFSSIGLIVSQLLPLILAKFKRPLNDKIGKAEKELDTMFLHIEKKKLFLLYTLPPVVLGVAGLLFLRHFIFLIIGIALGFSLPTIIIKRLQVQRKARFQAQLLDGILILSSSLKGGLSLLQAVETLVEELPPPISQEFGLVLRENKMGITLDESLKRLSDRMKISELGFLVNSILVAKETGGDLTKVLSRLGVTIRDSQKLKEDMETLTLQGRLQGLVMSLLPFIFIIGILSVNRDHFDIMLRTEFGRVLLVVAAVLQAVGIILIRRFSTLKI